MGKISPNLVTLLPAKKEESRSCRKRREKGVTIFWSVFCQIYQFFARLLSSDSAKRHDTVFLSSGFCLLFLFALASRFIAVVKVNMDLFAQDEIDGDFAFLHRINEPSHFFAKRQKNTIKWQSSDVYLGTLVNLYCQGLKLKGM
jgi:hypothetical protein